MEARFSTSSPEETTGLGRLLAERLVPGAVVALTGELGSGKTVLVQGVALGLGFDGYVSSPSFVIVNEYEGRLPIYHIDLYRMDGPELLDGLGYRELFWSEGVALVEWADRAGGLLPPERIDVRITIRNRSERLFVVSARGRANALILESLETEWKRLGEIASADDRDRDAR
jgi:tRNA threonylcarbamoyladenosine biosynthesis protein TsaE